MSLRPQSCKAVPIGRAARSSGCRDSRSSRTGDRAAADIAEPHPPIGHRAFAFAAAINSTSSPRTRFLGSGYLRVSAT